MKDKRNTQQVLAQRYKDMLQPLADAEVRIYGDMLAKASAAWQAGAGLSREYSTDEMREFFANIGTDTAGMIAKYGELASVFKNRKRKVERNQWIRRRR